MTELSFLGELFL